MAITASSVGTGDSLETFRQEFNNSVVDLGNLDGASVSEITIVANNSANETVFPIFVDGATGTQGLESDTGLTYNPSTGLITTATLTTTGLITSGSNIVIADAGTIGSASDTNAIGISSGGVVSITATTANTSASDGALTVAGGAGIAADLSVGDDLRLISDAAVLSFGADSDVTLTHVADTGILLNSTMAIQFNDASQYINAPSNAILDINATDEIELNATLADVNANLDVSGTYTGGGLMTTGGNIVIPDAGNIGSASDTDAIAISSGGVVTFSQTPIFSGDLQIEDDLILDSDAAVISFGEDNEVTLTHVHNTGILLNSTMQLQFNDASQNINAPSATVLDINATDEIELNATLVDVNGNLDVSGTIVGASTITASGIIKTDDATEATSTTDGSLQTDGGLSVVKDAVFGDDIKLLSDSAVIHFGADSDITLTHAADTSLTTNGVMIATTFEPSGDTASGDNAAIGYTSAEGLILTGQGSTSDITLKNDADATVFTVPTGTDDILFPDSARILMGAGSDLEIKHTGSHSYLMDSGTGDLYVAGSTVYISNAATDEVGLKFVQDGAVELYHNNNKKLETSSAGISVSGSITSSGAVNPNASDAAALGSASLEWSDLFIADGGIIYFGDDQEITLTHVADVGLNLKHTATADDKPIILTLQTGETDMQANDVLGEIRWQAPDEGTGTDAIAIAASIVAISEGNFAADNNATKMEFRLGSSEAATQKATLSSNGNFQVDGTLTCDPLATLLIKNAAGSTLKTINGVTSN